jgi:hypothetical protein
MVPQFIQRPNSHGSHYDAIEITDSDLPGAGGRETDYAPAFTGEAKMAHFTAIPPKLVVRPACPKCCAQMWLTRIQPDKAGYNRRLFECPRCQHKMTEVMLFEKVA